MRDVYDICEMVMEIIPDTEIVLLQELRKFSNSLWNKAPELRKGSELWIQFGIILQQYIGESFDKDWKMRVINIYNDKDCYNIEH